MNELDKNNGKRNSYLKLEKKEKKIPVEVDLVSCCEKEFGVCSCNVLRSPLEIYSCPLSFLQAEYETFCMCVFLMLLEIKFPMEGEHLFDIYQTS